jgi:hypothetical protein
LYHILFFVSFFFASIFFFVYFSLQIQRGKKNTMEKLLKNNAAFRFQVAEFLGVSKVAQLTTVSKPLHTLLTNAPLCVYYHSRSYNDLIQRQISFLPCQWTIVFCEMIIWAVLRWSLPSSRILVRRLMCDFGVDASSVEKALSRIANHPDIVIKDNVAPFALSHMLRSPCRVEMPVRLFTRMWFSGVLRNMETTLENVFLTSVEDDLFLFVSAADIRSGLRGLSLCGGLDFSVVRLQITEKETMSHLKCDEAIAFVSKFPPMGLCLHLEIVSRDFDLEFTTLMFPQVIISTAFFTAVFDKEQRKLVVTGGQSFRHSICRTCLLDFATGTSDLEILVFDGDWHKMEGRALTLNNLPSSLRQLIVSTDSLRLEFTDSKLPPNLPHITYRRTPSVFWTHHRKQGSMIRDAIQVVDELS